jgi:glycosyltransferase involved in cell wall biosynthesis
VGADKLPGGEVGVQVRLAEIPPLVRRRAVHPSRNYTDAGLFPHCDWTKTIGIVFASHPRVALRARHWTIALFTPLSIVHVAAPAPFGGLESVVRLLAIGHRARGHEVRVAAIVTDPGADLPLLRVLEASGVEVLRLAVPGRGYLRERALAGDLYRRIRPDVVHTHGYRADVVDTGPARSLAIPTVTTVHGFTGGDWKNRLYERLQMRAFRRFDRVVAVSDSLAQQLRRSGIGDTQLHTIPNAYDAGDGVLDRRAARRELALPDDAFVVGWVGRLSAEKGPDVMIDAAALVGQPVVVAMVGDGPEHHALQARADARGIAERVAWCGRVIGAGRVFPAFDVFALSSRTEGVPIVLFEAMASGVPIVATRVGGVPSTVSANESVLVPSESPEALARAIDGVRENPSAARERAQSARRRLVDDFGIGPWLDRYEALYRGIREHARDSGA